MKSFGFIKIFILSTSSTEAIPTAYTEFFLICSEIEILFLSNKNRLNLINNNLIFWKHHACFTP